MADKKKIIGAAAGVAAAATAATAAGIAVKRRRTQEPVTYRVRPYADGWKLMADGAEQPESTHGTKKEALGAARRLAASHAPSQLVIHRADGTVQRRHSYGDQ